MPFSAICSNLPELFHLYQPAAQLRHCRQCARPWRMNWTMLPFSINTLISLLGRDAIAHLETSHYTSRTDLGFPTEADLLSVAAASTGQEPSPLTLHPPNSPINPAKFLALDHQEQALPRDRSAHNSPIRRFSLASSALARWAPFIRSPAGGRRSAARQNPDKICRTRFAARTSFAGRPCSGPRFLRPCIDRYRWRIRALRRSLRDRR